MVCVVVKGLQSASVDWRWCRSVCDEKHNCLQDIQSQNIFPLIVSYLIFFFFFLISLWRQKANSNVLSEDDDPGGKKKKQRWKETRGGGRREAGTTYSYRKEVQEVSDWGQTSSNVIVNPELIYCLGGHDWWERTSVCVCVCFLGPAIRTLLVGTFHFLFLTRCMFRSHGGRMVWALALQQQVPQDLKPPPTVQKTYRIRIRIGITERTEGMNVCMYGCLSLEHLNVRRKINFFAPHINRITSGIPSI